MSRILEDSNDEDGDCTAWKQMDFTCPPTKIRGNRGAKIVINVSGLRYETFEKTLETFPDSLLGDKHRRSFFFDPDQNEFFFDRNRICFESILAYYQTSGVLIRPPNIPRKVFLSDIRFFDLGDEALQQAGDTLEEPIEKRRNPLPRNKLQRIIWDLFEHPETSKFARALAIWSVCVILLSIILFCVETLPQFQKQSNKNKNGTSTSVEPSTKQKNIFFVIEAFCITWFTVEYVFRFVVSPRKWKFLISVLNIIDLVSILPFYITLPMEGNASVSSLAILRSVRLVRVFRIFKLSRYSRGLQILGHTLKASLRELGLLFFFLCMGVILFSSAVYYAEISNENANDFKSIPHSFWWAIITMTTVGYGDITPKTLGGKLVGCFCAISGVLAIALPVPVIVSNFAYYYSKEHGRQTNIDGDEEGEDEEGDEMEEEDDIDQNGTNKMGSGFNYAVKDSDKSSNRKSRKRKTRNGKYPRAVYNSLNYGLPLENQNAVTNSHNGVKHQQGSDNNKHAQFETVV